MARPAARLFQRELDLLIDRFRAEYLITTNEMVRALETTYEELIDEQAAAEVESDGDEDDP